MNASKARPGGQALDHLALFAQPVTITKELAMPGIPEDSPEDKGTSEPSDARPTSSPPRTPSAWEKALTGKSTSSVRGYDPSKFYTQASDIKGHGESVNVKFPPEVLREVHKLVGSGAFPPYEFASDFIRDAVHHHLHSRAGMIGDPEVRASLAEFFLYRNLQERLERARRGSEFWSSQSTYWDNVFVHLARDGAWGQLCTHLREVEDVVDEAPEPYQTAVLSVIERWWKRVPDGYR